MKRTLLLPSFSLIALLPGCMDPNPAPEHSEAQRAALVGSENQDLTEARDELAALNAEIAKVLDEQKREQLEGRAKQLGGQVETAGKKMAEYESKGDTEGAAGVMMSQLADVRAQIEALTAAVAKGQY
jgi:small-conductance mechanosensitive channel